MIKKVKSRLTVKVFLLTLLLAMTCCLSAYSFLTWFVPNVYRYKLEDAEEWISYMPELTLTVNKEEGFFLFEETNKDIQKNYEQEFELHFFQSDGQEVSLTEHGSLTGKRLTDFDEIEKTKAYPITFSDSDSTYTLLLARNPAKRTQLEQALQTALPPLCVFIFVCSMVSAFFYSWYMTSPIKKVSKLSRQMADLDFSGLCPAGRTDEIGVLSDSLNTLAQNLETALSELREANQKLQADIDMERRLERQRAEFFAAASHELKTPIAIIKGQLEGMLYQVGRYKDVKTYLAQSLEVTGSLEKMVGELLTASRLDTPGFACQKSRLNLSELISVRLAAYEDYFMQNALKAEPFISPEIYLSGDEKLIQKVLDNLFGNAAAYSEAGNRIIVKLWKKTEKIILTIENTGAHIPDEDIPKLFEAFYRVDHSRNRRTGGTGLGLYIVKTILDLHDADIEIENTERGVIVTVKF